MNVYRDKILENIFYQWTKCKNNHIYLENKSNTQVFFPIYNIEDINKKTLYIDNCNNIDLYVNTKINHIILIHCSNINLYLSDGLISGLDILHSKNINSYITNKKINFSEISNCDDCNYYFNFAENNDNVGVDDNFYINTNYCYNIRFNINEHIDIMTNQSLFDTIKYFVLNKNNIICIN